MPTCVLVYLCTYVFRYKLILDNTIPHLHIFLLSDVSPHRGYFSRVKVSVDAKNLDQ